MSKQHDVGGHLEVFEKIDFSDAPLLLWEKQIHAILGILVRKNIIAVDELRRATEQLDPSIYTKWSYYGKWACALSQICIEKGLLNSGDILWDSKESTHPELQLFNIGDYVKVREENIFTKWCKPHIRTPGYIFGTIGRIESYAGQFIDPEQIGWGVKDQELLSKQHVFRVRFFHKDLWSDYIGNDEDNIEVEVFQNWLQKSSEDDFLVQKKNRVKFSLKSSMIEHHTKNNNNNENCDHDHHKHEHKHNNNNNNNHDDHHHHHHDDHHHDHHHHDHGEDHEHDERPVIEQTAVDREDKTNSGTIGRQFAELFVKVIIGKQIATEEEIRAVVERVETMGTNNEGARIVAKAWCDSGFKERLLKNGNEACLELGIVASNSHASTFLKVVENTDTVHNLIVCTLCSCYPLNILGISPSWYKSRSYRARAVKEPRILLKEFGTSIGDDIVIRVHDSTSDLRFMVLPQRPKGTELLSEEELVKIVTRDSMIGVTVLQG